MDNRCCSKCSRPMAYDDEGLENFDGDKRVCLECFRCRTCGCTPLNGFSVSDDMTFECLDCVEPNQSALRAARMPTPSDDDTRDFDGNRVTFEGTLSDAGLDIGASDADLRISLDTDSLSQCNIAQGRSLFTTWQQQRVRVTIELLED